MATIRQRVNRNGITSYHVQIRFKGHKAETASFARLTDARRWAQQTEAAMRQGRHFPGSTAKQHTLAEAIDRYTHSVLPRKKPNTIAVQRAQLGWWRAQIGHLRLTDVTPAVLSDKRDSLLQEFLGFPYDDFRLLPCGFPTPVL